MSLGQEIAPHLPFLRRYARALTGSQHHGDSFVRATLEAIVAAPASFPRDVDPRVGLYRTFHAIWSSANIEEDPGAGMAGDGAEGIAQFMPGTAAAYGLRNPFDPDAAIDAQAHLMHDLLRQFGAVPLALAAYNAGMGRVNGWKKQGLLGADLIDFVESIPLRETRDYVAQIIRNHYWYAARVLDTKAQPLDHFWSAGAKAKTGRCAPKPQKTPGKKRRGAKT